MKKSLSTMLAVLMVGSMAIATGCNNNTTGGGNKTQINIMNTGGGIGRVWLDNAIERFTAANEGRSFETGKNGIKIEVEHNLQTGEDSMNSSGYHIYFVEDCDSIASFAAENKLLPITDIVTTKNETRDGEKISIEDKIDESYRFALQGLDGEYYALPHFSWLPGLTYDAELFRAKNFYLADYTLDDDEVFTYESKFGSAKFVLNEQTPKSLGNDGKRGTADDGLPCTLQEFLILCARIKSSAIPFQLNGRSNHYISYLIRGLWTSLSGYDTMERMYTFDGPMEVVTGYSDTETLFENISYIPKPETQVVDLTEANGYLATDNVARYYATALIEIIEKEGWMSSDATGNTTHITAQSNFLLSGFQNKPSYGMLIEGNYWYNESMDNNNFKNYEIYTKKSADDLSLKWMPLPTSFNTPVTSEENAREYAMIDAANSFAFINNNIADKPELAQACKEFLAFLYTDAELSHFVGTTGVIRAAMDYKVLDEDFNKLSNFQKSVMATYENAKVLYGAAENATFRTNRKQIILTGNSKILEPKLGVLYNNYYEAIRAGKTAKDIFEVTRTSKSVWEESYYAK